MNAHATAQSSNQRDPDEMSTGLTPPPLLTATGQGASRPLQRDSRATRPACLPLQAAFRTGLGAALLTSAVLTTAVLTSAVLGTGCNKGNGGPAEAQSVPADMGKQASGGTAGNAPSSSSGPLEAGLPDVDTAQTDALVGKPAPEFEVSLRNGNTLSLAGLRGKVVVLNFWATWCPPCIEEIPALNRLYRSIEGMGVEVIGISVDDSWAKVDEMLLKRPVAFTLALDTARGIPSRFGTEKFPETFILDKNGKIVKKLIGAQLWDRGDYIALLESLAKAP